MYFLHIRYCSKLCTCTDSALAIPTWSWAITLLCVSSEAHRMEVLATQTLYLGFGPVRLTFAIQDSHELQGSTVYGCIKMTKLLNETANLDIVKGIKTGISKSPKHNTFQKEEVANSFICARGYKMPVAPLLSQ